MTGIILFLWGVDLFITPAVTCISVICHISSVCLSSVVWWLGRQAYDPVTLIGYEFHNVYENYNTL